MNGLAENITFKSRLDPERFELTATAEVTDNVITLLPGDSTAVKFNGLEQTCKYSLEYLTKFMEAHILSDLVVIRFSTDFPLVLQFDKTDKFLLEFVLAPRVDSE